MGGDPLKSARGSFHLRLDLPHSRESKFCSDKKRLFLGENFMRKIHIGITMLLAVIATGCASVKVYKVVTNPDGTEKIDKHVEGIPYYVPRPWLEVYDPFVVSAKPYFINAQLTPDGKYLQLASLPVELKDTGLNTLFPVTGNPAPAVIQTPAPQAGQNALEGATPGSSSSGKKSNSSTTSINSTTNTSTNNTTNTSTTSTNSTNAGKSSVKVTSTSDFYITPGRRFFDIVYLPDYADKRIIQIHGGLGKSDLSVTLAQGWSLAALNASVDNTELAKEIFKTWDTGLQLAQKAATTALFPPASALQGQAANGTIVTCKIIDSEMVAPGLYPIPKDITYPTVGAIADGNSPVTRLGLTTYHVYTIEALQPTGDSPLKFTQYATAGGTKNDTNSANGPDASVAPQNQPIDLTAIGNAVKADLQTSADFATYKDQVQNVSATSTDGKNISFTLTLKAAPADKATQSKIEAAFDLVAGNTLQGYPGTPKLKKPTNVTPAPAN